MDTKKIRFVANRPWLNEQSFSRPGPIAKTIPERYKNPVSKACPAVFGLMGTGYTYKTPCDIEFVEDKTGTVHARVLDAGHPNFLVDREPLHQFLVPDGYHAEHFAWWADWAVELPEGYSALYTHPLNRFDLPFITTSGIVDNDKDHLPGTMPFFFLKGVTGILRAGTPYAQIIPFKREHWQSDVNASLTREEMEAEHQANSAELRQPDGGVDLSEAWK